MKKLLSILALLLWANPAFAAFAYKGTFTVQAAQMPASQTDFSFLIYWTDNVLKVTGSGGQVTDAQGDDIRPYSTSDCSTTALTYQRFYYDGTAGTVGMYVKHTGGVGAVIYLCVGDSGITTDGSSTGAWDASTLLVMPFPDGTTLDVMDYSASNNDGTNSGYAAGAGKINGGAVGDTSTDHVDLASSVLGDGNPPVTVRAWINTTDLTATNVLFSQGVVGGGGAKIYLAVNASAKIEASVDGTNADTNTTNTVSTSTWTFVGFTFTGGLGGTVAFYFNGGADGTATRSAAYQSTDTAAVGNYISNGGTYSLPVIGTIDDLRVDNVVRSANWLVSEYNNQNSQATFWGTVTFASTSGGTGYTTPRGIVRP